MRELLERILKFAQENYPVQMNGLIAEINIELAKPEPKFFVIDWPDYDYEGMECGLEDSSITDRYKAMRYGWDCALDRVSEVLPDKIYTHPPAQQKPLSDDEILGIFASWEVLPIDTDKELIEMARAIEQAHGIK